MSDQLTSFISRVFFIIAFVLIGLAVFDWCIRLFGWTITWIGYNPGRILEISALLMIFVIALQLRAIHQDLKKT